MSSSLVVQKMREEVQRRGRTDIKIGACAKTQYLKYLDEADVLLIAPQLTFMREELAKLENMYHVRIGYIDPEAYGRLDAKMILDEALEEGKTKTQTEEGRIVQWLKQRIIPIANKVAGNRALTSVTMGFTSILPVTITGACLRLLGNIPYTPYTEWLTSVGLASLLELGVDMTTNILSIYLCFYVAYHYVKLNDEHGHPCGILAVICFLMITGVDDEQIEMVFLGSNGIFTALLVSLLVGYLYVRILRRNRLIRPSSTIPKQVLRSLNAIIPFFYIILIFMVFTALTRIGPYGNLHLMIYESIQKSLTAYLSNNIFSYMLINWIANALWFLGLHGGNITGSVTALIYTPMGLENFALYSAGKEPIHIISNAFSKCFISGGVGSMFSLSIIMAFKAKSQKFKALGRISLPTTFFYINEPLLFGIPIVLNPLFLIPLLFITPILSLLTYFVMHAGIVPIPNGMMLPWTTPPVIYGLLQGSWKIALWEIVSIILSGMMWYPFFKIADQREVEAENKNRHN